MYMARRTANRSFRGSKLLMHKTRVAFLLLRASQISFDSIALRSFMHFVGDGEDNWRRVASTHSLKVWKLPAPGSLMQTRLPRRGFAWPA